MNKLFTLIFFSFLFCLSTSGQQLVSIETSKGEIIIKLYDETPKHKANFMRLVQEDFYDSLLFHRVIKNFMIQCGDPNSKNASRYTQLGNGGPGYTLEAEIKPQFIHKKGALSAARVGDEQNPQRKSSGSQFYIVQGGKYLRKYMPRFEEKRGKKYTEEELIAYETLGGTPHLDGQYTIFGEVVKGLDIIEAISNAATNNADRPLEDIYIINMKLIK